MNIGDGKVEYLMGVTTVRLGSEFRVAEPQWRRSGCAGAEAQWQSPSSERRRD